MTIKQIIKKYNLQKTDDSLYTYKITLENLKTDWYIKIENSSIDKKLFNIFTRFDNYEILSKVNKQIECNTWSGKCNRYCFCLQQIENFINEVTTCRIL